MHRLTLTATTVVAVLYTSWVHANQLPQTAEYGITYDNEGTAGQVRGRVSPRYHLAPQSASFGVGAAKRREMRHVRVGLPAELADAPVQASSTCGEVALEVQYQREADNSLVVQVRNASDFPAGTLHCGVALQVGAEQVLIPVLALTR